MLVRSWDKSAQNHWDSSAVCHSHNLSCISVLNRSKHTTLKQPCFDLAQPSPNTGIFPLYSLLSIETPTPAVPRSILFGPDTVQTQSRDGPESITAFSSEPLTCWMKFHSNNYFNIGILPSIIALCSNKFLPLFLLAFPQSYSRTLSRFLFTTFASLNRKFKKQKTSPIYEFLAFKFDSFPAFEKNVI